MGSVLTSVFIFLAILSLVVVIHELGHLLAAKFFGVLVEEFGLGLPPRAMRFFKKGETEYTLNWLPLGGFVRLYGENGEISAEVPDKRAFWAKPVWQRAIIVLAGVIMNFLLGTVLFGAVYTYLGIPTPTDKVIISGMEQGSPADQAGFSLGDQLVLVSLDDDSQAITSSESAVDWLYGHQGEAVIVTVSRAGQERELTVKLREDPDHQKGVLGVVLDDTQLIHYPLWQMPFRGIWFGFKEAEAWGKEILTSMGQLLSSLLIGQVPEGLAGPVGIYNISKAAAKEGWLVTFKFVGVLSVNLAILNVLPIPALDGGRLVFLAIEAVTRRRVARALENWVNSIGMIILLAFMAFITINDLANLGVGEKLLQFIGSIGNRLK